ncbi:MAG: (deoxy)nucleoside triphosphate pyrophosphohydrolase [Syntrophales bacterium]
MPIQVACAIIERNGLVLAAQRGASMRMPLKWEFPGGKIEPGEGAEACLHRELMEEMGLGVVVKWAMPPSMHHYPTFMVKLYPFVCVICSGEMTLNEHHAVVWLKPDDLPTLDWVEADLAVVEAYRELSLEH